MKNDLKMKIIIVATSSILCLCGCTNNKEQITSEDNIEEKILENLKQIGELSDTVSSNPYDYIKNENYKNIIKLGKKAVPVLEEMYNSNKISGVYAYISALAVQDITGCNLYEEYDLDWSIAEEFYTLWKDNNCGLKN